MPTTADHASPFSSLVIGPITLRNRFIKAATNEGMSPGGTPSKQLVQFHERIAAGGVGMTTVAYCAVSPDGRSFVDQTTLNTDNVPHLQAVTNAVHRHGAAASVQLTHGGCFTFVDQLNSGRPLSSSGGFNNVGILSGKWRRQRMGTTDLTQVADEFVRSAKLARDAGFDAVELHMGHGYLLSQFLSPLYNHRRDEYGGTPEQRARFPAEVLSRVLDAVGKDLAVVCKISVLDGIKRGNTAVEGARIARVLEAAGAHLLVLSAGLSAASVDLMFGSSFPTDNYPDFMGGPITKLALWLHQLTAKKVEFHEMYLLEHARQVRAATRMPLAYLGGVKTLANVEQALQAGFEAVTLGRALVHDPQLIADFAAGKTLGSACTACNLCTAMMYTPGGTSCVLRTPGNPALNAQPAAA